MTGEPWGLSGPQFLVVFFSALVVTGALPFLHDLLTRRSAGSPPGDVDVYASAHLADGGRRVALAALVTLSEQERVRIGASGDVTPVGAAAVPAPRPGGDTSRAAVEDAVLAVVVGGPGRRSGEVIRAARAAPVMAGLEDQLVAAGLLVPPADVRRRRLTLLPLAVLLVVGSARWVGGVRLGRPVGYLTLLLVVGVALLVVAALKAPRRTPAGDAMLARLVAERDVPAWRAPRPDAAAGNGADLTLVSAVAVLGVAGLAATHPLHQRLTTGGDGSGGGGGGDGGGDGGGGCGGCGG